jgi:hypothetical protein
VRRPDKYDFNFRALVMLVIPGCIAGNTCTADLDWTSLSSTIFSGYVIGLFVFFLMIAYFEYKINLHLHAKKFPPIDIVILVLLFISVRNFAITSIEPIVSLRWWCTVLFIITAWDTYTFIIGCKCGIFKKESIRIVPMLELVLDALVKNFTIRNVSLSEEYRYWMALDGLCLAIFSLLYLVFYIFNIQINKELYVISQAVLGGYIVSLNSYRYYLILHSRIYAPQIDIA